MKKGNMSIIQGWKSNPHSSQLIRKPGEIAFHSTVLEYKSQESQEDLQMLIGTTYHFPLHVTYQCANVVAYKPISSSSCLD